MSKKRKAVSNLLKMFDKSMVKEVPNTKRCYEEANLAESNKRMDAVDNLDRSRTEDLEHGDIERMRAHVARQ